VSGNTTAGLSDISDEKSEQKASGHTEGVYHSGIIMLISVKHVFA